MARLTPTIKVTFAWWLKPYLYGVVSLTMMTGLEPDYDKVKTVIRRAIRMRLI